MLPANSVDLWFTSPPYADARAYSRIDPGRYVEWFLPFGKQMLSATADSGWLVLNIKNRVAKSGPLQGQRHPYVYELVLALQQQGWRWLETYIWFKPNGVPGRFGPRTKDSFEYLYAFAKGPRPHFDLDAIRVPYRTTPEEIERRRLDTLGRRNTDAGFGRDRTRTYRHGGADPGNVVTVPQTYNQHRGAGGHTAAMPEKLAEFFIRACSPAGGVVIDPFAGSGTTAVAARRLGRRPAVSRSTGNSLTWRMNDCGGMCLTAPRSSSISLRDRRTQLSPGPGGIGWRLTSLLNAIRTTVGGS